jgi:Membrane protein implicated in regulation of membrane protease activity
MEQFAWLVWIILGVCLIIAETFTFGFVLFWFGLGALAAALASFLGVGVIGQFIVFAVVSSVLTAMSRTIFVKYFSNAESVKMGIDALPGQIGTVTTKSRGALNEAAVKVYGSIWTAFPVDGEKSLEEGEKVEVVRVQGATIYVRKISDSKELPGWRSE